jgi:hypothetical protein
MKTSVMGGRIKGHFSRLWTNEMERPLFLCEEDRTSFQSARKSNYAELVKIKEDAVGNVKERIRRGKQKRVKRSLIRDQDVCTKTCTISMFVLLSCPTRNHVILKDAFTVLYFHGTHLAPPANRNVRHFVPDQ